MKTTYILKPFKKNEKLDAIDRERRAKVEAISGQMSDYQWLNYKRMTQTKDKNH